MTTDGMDRATARHERRASSCPTPTHEPGLRAWWRDTCPAHKLQLLTIPFWIWLIVRGR